MGTYPNTGLTQSLALWYGSCKIEISEDDGATWVNVGLARSVKVEEQFDQTAIQADNGPDINDAIGNQKILLTFNGLEFYLPTLDKIRGGIDLLTYTSGALCTRTDCWTSGTWTFGTPLFLSRTGDSTTSPTLSTVSNWKTGTTTKLTTLLTPDFAKTKNSLGNVNGLIVLTTGGGFATRSMKVEYVYRDIAARKLTSGGLTTITPKMYRLTNKQMVSGVAKYRYITLYSASLNAGMNLAFKSSNESDCVLETPISILADIDATRTEGDQLFMIEDEVATL